MDATVTLFQIDREKLSGLVYDKEETKARRRSRGGGVKTVKLWRRTSQLLRGERYYFRGSGADTEGIIDNRVAYAAARHERKYPAKTQYRTLAGSGKKAVYQWRSRPDRTAHWRDETLKTGNRAASEDFWRAMAVAENSS